MRTIRMYIMKNIVSDLEDDVCYPELFDVNLKIEYIWLPVAGHEYFKRHFSTSKWLEPLFAASA